VFTYSYVDTILHGATLEIKMGSPDASGGVDLVVTVAVVRIS